MKKTKALINKLLAELEKTPLIQIACDKVGISRNTFYRWMKEDKEFLSRTTEAISLGTGLVNDVAISNVLEGIKRKDPMYTKYWLDRKHHDFRRPFRFKIDSDDILTQFRLMMESIKVNQVEQDIKNALGESERKEIEDDKREMEEWEAMWFKEKNS